MPAGAVVASALSYPTRLDFGRNPVYCLDLPGGAKTGEWPFDKGPDGLLRFMADQGVDYLAWQDGGPKGGLYGRAIWDENAARHDPNAPNMIELLTNLPALQRSTALVYAYDGFYVCRVRP